MAHFLAGRLVALGPVLLVVAVVSFILVHFIPGDPVQVMLGDQATEESLKQIRHEMGLDQPLLLQFVRWFGRVLVGDLGNSITLHIPVAQAIAERLQPTLMLGLLSLTFAITVSIPMGIVAAIHRNRWVDQAIMFTSMIGLSVPNFWLGILLIFVFGVELGWLPTLGYQPLSEGFASSLRYLVMPSIALGFAQAALITRMVRSSMLDVLGQDYVRTARAKGLPRRVVIYQHALKNAMIPVITVLGLSFAGIASGAVVIETVFNIPGVGRLIYDAIRARDYFLIQGVLLVTAGSYVVINLATDILYLYVDPRIKYR